MFPPVEPGEAPGAGGGGSGGGDGGGGESSRPGLPLEPMRLVWALRRRLRFIALVVLASVPVGVLAAYFLAPREFVSQAVLLWEPVESSSAPARELQTIANSVKLPANIEQVRERLQLSETLEALGKRISVDAVSNESNVVTITGEADTAEAAAALAQTVTDVFLASRVGVARTRDEERLQGLGEEVTRLMQQLSAARSRYDEFRARNHLWDVEADRRAASEQLAQLRIEITRNRIEADTHAMKAQLLRSALEKSSPQLVLTENQVQADRAKLAELSAQLTARRASLSPEHPEVLGLQASVDALEQKPPADYMVTGRQVGSNPAFVALQGQLTSADIEGKTAEQKWQSYSKLRDSLDQRLAELTAVEGEAGLLLEDIRLAEQRLGQLKAQQKVLEAGALQPTAELRVLNSPMSPLWPAQSARRKVALVFPLVAALLAVLFVLAQELWRLRLRAPAELAFWANAPVLASSSWPQEPEELRGLAQELLTQGARARGTTLWLPLEPTRAPQATELVEALRAEGPDGPRVWDGADRVQALRRAARESARVVVLVDAGAHSPLALLGLRRWLGREEGIGLVVLGLGPELAQLSDRVGDVPGFWGTPAAHAPPPAREPHPLESPPRRLPQR